MMRTLSDLVDRCDVCQRTKRAPIIFRVSLKSEDLRFNQRVNMDIMYIDSQLVLYIVDKETHFSAAQLLTNISDLSVWDATA